MASGKTIQCRLITPEAVLLDEPVISARFTAHDGSMGVWPLRAPLLCKLGIGELRVSREQGEARFYIDGGFAQMLDNELTILAPKALAVEKIDSAAIGKELARLAEASPSTPADQALRAANIQRARTQLKLATKE